MTFQNFKIKVVALLAAVALALAFAACGDDGEEVSNPPGDVALAEESSQDGKRPAVWRTEQPPDEEHPGQAEFGAPPLEFEADPSGKMAYTTNEVTATEGNVSIEFTNPQSVPHNVAIEGVKTHGKVETETIEDDFAATSMTLNTDEKFIFYCTVPGHREAGMEGVVKVKPA
jgi:plastocyanin